MQITQAILPVAGLGTRFLPWTKVVPKELLPIGNEPIIAHIVDECMSIGITEICFVINKGKEAIPQYFYEHPELEEELARRGKSELVKQLQRYDEIKFHVVYQEEQHGDGHAILQALEWVHTDAVAVLFGDDLIVGEQNGLEQLKQTFDRFVVQDPEKIPAVLCLQEVPEERVHKYGIVDVSKIDTSIKSINGLVEKPDPKDAPSNLGIVGKYIVPKTVLDLLPELLKQHTDGELRLIDAFKASLGNVPIYGCQFTGTRYDTGHPEGYREAVKDLG